MEGDPVLVSPTGERFEDTLIMEWVEGSLPSAGSGPGFPWASLPPTMALITAPFDANNPVLYPEAACSDGGAAVAEAARKHLVGVVDEARAVSMTFLGKGGFGLVYQAEVKADDAEVTVLASAWPHLVPLPMAWVVKVLDNMWHYKKPYPTYKQNSQIRDIEAIFEATNVSMSFIVREELGAAMFTMLLQSRWTPGLVRFHDTRLVFTNDTEFPKQPARSKPEELKKTLETLKTKTTLREGSATSVLLSSLLESSKVSSAYNVTYGYDYKPDGSRPVMLSAMEFAGNTVDRAIRASSLVTTPKWDTVHTIESTYMFPLSLEVEQFDKNDPKYLLTTLSKFQQSHIKHMEETKIYTTVGFKDASDNLVKANDNLEKANRDFQRLNEQASKLKQDAISEGKGTPAWSAAKLARKAALAAKTNAKKALENVEALMEKKAKQEANNGFMKAWQPAGILHRKDDCALVLQPSLVRDIGFHASVLILVLHAMAALQVGFTASHGDLKLGNVALTALPRGEWWALTVPASFKGGNTPFYNGKGFAAGTDESFTVYLYTAFAVRLVDTNTAIPHCYVTSVLDGAGIERPKPKHGCPCGLHFKGCNLKLGGMLEESPPKCKCVTAPKCTPTLPAVDATTECKTCAKTESNASNEKDCVSIAACDANIVVRQLANSLKPLMRMPKEHSTMLFACPVTLDDPHIAKENTALLKGVSSRVELKERPKRRQHYKRPTVKDQVTSALESFLQEERLVKPGKEPKKLDDIAEEEKEEEEDGDEEDESPFLPPSAPANVTDDGPFYAKNMICLLERLMDPTGMYTPLKRFIITANTLAKTAHLRTVVRTEKPDVPVDRTFSFFNPPAIPEHLLNALNVANKVAPTVGRSAAFAEFMKTVNATVNTAKTK